MDRRNFLKKSFLFAAVSAIAGNSIGLFSQAMASAKELLFVTEGKLGYKQEAPANKVKVGKTCGDCKYYQVLESEDENMKGIGQCTLVAMLKAMKADEVYVKEGATCNMFIKKV